MNVAAKPAGISAAAARPLSVVVKDIVQEYPAPGGSVTRVIDQVSLSFDQPGISMLLGPSGCGKSTLLHMLGGVRPMGIDTPTAGKVLIDGVECIGPHDDAVMVFQRYANRPDLTVFDNVAFPFRLNLWKARVPEAEWRQRVADILKAVGLADKLKLRPAQLSGGQNQRVALARALVLRPRILLMDEPFGALDAQTRGIMQSELRRIWQKTGSSVFFITHDIDEAITLGTRVGVMTAGPGGTLKELITIEIEGERSRADPAYVRYYAAIQEAIREEVEKAARQADGEAA